MAIIPYELIGPWLIGTVVGTTKSNSHHSHETVVDVKERKGLEGGLVIVLTHNNSAARTWGLWVTSHMYDDPDGWSLPCVDPVKLACLVEKKDTYDR